MTVNVFVSEQACLKETQIKILSCAQMSIFCWVKLLLKAAKLTWSELALLHKPADPTWSLALKRAHVCGPIQLSFLREQTLLCCRDRFVTRGLWNSANLPFSLKLQSSLRCFSMFSSPLVKLHKLTWTKKKQREVLEVSRGSQVEQKQKFTKTFSPQKSRNAVTLNQRTIYFQNEK